MVSESVVGELLAREAKPFDYERQLFNDHYPRVLAALRGENPPPYELEIQPTSRCNMKCSHCFGTHLTCRRLEDKIGEKEMQVLAERVAEFQQGDFGVETVKFCGTTGEPLVNPNTAAAIPLFRALGKKVILYTNGLFLDKKTADGKYYLEYAVLADKTNISLDAAERRTFKTVKGIDGFDRVIRNIQALTKLRKEREAKTRVDVSYVINNYNCFEIEKAADLIGQTGADNLIFRIDFTDSGELRKIKDYLGKALEGAKAKSTQDFRILCSNSDLAEENNECKGRCYNHHFWACVGPDHEGYFCGHRTYFGVKSYGDVLSHPFKELWNSEERRAAIANLPDEFCRFCSPSSLRRNIFMDIVGGMPLEKVQAAHEKYVVKGAA